MLAGRRRRLTAGSLALMGAAGGVLTGLSPNSAAVGIGCVAAFSAGAQLTTGLSLGIVSETVAAFLISGLVTGASTGQLLGYSWAIVGLWTIALTRREFLVRAEQAEHTLTETRRAREAETQAAALAERARIARDIHDVLAHSLAAVSVNLQAAEGLLTAGTLPQDNPELVKAIECLGRAGTLTREGLATARRAVLALRDDATPLAERLSSLADQYREVGDLAVDFEVTGQPRPIPVQAGQAAYRAAQEALTNARKHAPGQPVRLHLGFEPDEITVSVVNPLPPKDAQGPLAAAAGQAVLDPEVQQRLLLAAARAPAAAPSDDGEGDLTPRESDVLRLIAEGKSNREIARALFVSEATVKTHVNRIFAKTGSRDRTQAMRYAYTHGYAEPPGGS
jgi:signal transduction histidine kinase/DNA-binding CsgD family transcriptional regulator